MAATSSCAHCGADTSDLHGAPCLRCGGVPAPTPASPPGAPAGQGTWLVVAAIAAATLIGLVLLGVVG